MVLILVFIMEKFNSLDIKFLYKVNMIAKRLEKIAHVFRFSVDKKFKYSFDFASHMIPHPAKAYKGGQDAIFTSKNLLVVADGVGGWADSGVDPGLYSKKLCEIIGKKVKKNQIACIEDPKQMLIEAVKQNKQMGSTTVCILTLHPETGKMINYYLGDSVFGFFYPDKYLIAPEQQKSFNFPYQVGSVGDDPTQGFLIDIVADEYLDAMIVMGSDGVWDNYDEQKISQDLYEKMKDKTLQETVEFIAKNTYKFSLSENYESPFYKKALSHGYRYQKGGKSDDISLILAKIVKEEL